MILGDKNLGDNVINLAFCGKDYSETPLVRQGKGATTNVVSDSIQVVRCWSSGVFPNARLYEPRFEVPRFGTVPDPIFTFQAKALRLSAQHTIQLSMNAVDLSHGTSFSLTL